MNADNVNFNTPKQTRRLGLRRSSSVLRNTTGTVPEERYKMLENENTFSTPKIRKLQSDVKINYKNLERNTCSKNASNSDHIPSTPESSDLTDFQRQAVSTNCRPYRLALSKRVREKMTKKRLEFYLANEIDKEEPSKRQTESELQQDSQTERSTQEVLLEQIETAQNELNTHQEHIKKVEELRQAINVWKSGFSSALHDLQEKIEPRLEIEALLEHLRIPQEMIKYISD